MRRHHIGGFTLIETSFANTAARRVKSTAIDHEFW